MKWRLILIGLVFVASATSAQLASKVTSYAINPATGLRSTSSMSLNQFDQTGRVTGSKLYVTTNGRLWINNASEYRYDESGNQVFYKVQFWKQGTDTVFSIHEVTNTYNQSNQVVEEIYHDQEILSGNEYTARYLTSYDDKGCRKRIDFTGNSSSYTIYTTDASCRELSSRTYFSADQSMFDLQLFEYGPFGLVHYRFYYVRGDSTLQQEKLITYDQQGHKTAEVTVGLSRFDYFYDASGRPYKQTGYQWVDIAWRLSYEYLTTYDAQDRVATIRSAYFDESGNTTYSTTVTNEYLEDGKIGKITNYVVFGGNYYSYETKHTYRCDGLITSSLYTTTSSSNATTVLGDFQVIEYTYVEAADCEQPARPLVNFYPNPADDMILVNPLNNMRTEAVVRLYSPNGNFVSQYPVENQWPAQLDVRNLQTGFYILEIEQGQQKHRTRLFKR